MNYVYTHVHVCVCVCVCVQVRAHAQLWNVFASYSSTRVESLQNVGMYKWPFIHVTSVWRSFLYMERNETSIICPA